MQKFIEIKDGIVQNIGVFASRKDKPKGWIESKYADEIGIGWNYDKKTKKFKQPESELYQRSPKEIRRIEMYEGVQFKGVSCSTTKEDFWGIASVKTFLADHDTDFDFKFKNGNRLVLNRKNITKFCNKWLPARQKAVAMEEVTANDSD